MPRLKHVSCTGPGLQRRKRGKGFSYVQADGSPVTDPVTRQRIAELVIPPAWTDVWICPADNGHIQATGTDDAGRRQYVYHQVWREKRDLEKFDRMLDVAELLPALRERSIADLGTRGMTRRRVLACAVRLLDLGFFRIGGEEYAETHQTYGLATMRKKHVTIESGVITFDYTAKSGKHRIQHVADDQVVRVVKALKERKGGGHELLAYRSGKGWRDITSADINAHLREITGADISAKDFRTWNATVLAAVALSVSREAKSDSARKRAISRAVTEVSEYLGNTPSVCRASYIDPRVIDRYRQGRTIIDALGELGKDSDEGSLATQGAAEEAVLALLRGRKVADRAEAAGDQARRKRKAS